MRVVSLAVLFLLLLSVSTTTATAAACNAPWCFIVDVANCLAPHGSGTDMIFQSCDISGGTIISPPRTINAMESIRIIAKPASLTTPIIANCTWTYHEASRARNWTAFLDFEYAPFGNYAWGAGTNDTPDTEGTQLGSTTAGTHCAWYNIPSQITWDKCFIETNTTGCSIDKKSQVGYGTQRRLIVHRSGLRQNA